VHRELPWRHDHRRAQAQLLPHREHLRRPQRTRMLHVLPVPMYSQGPPPRSQRAMCVAHCLARAASIR
jgi:hypothetical protein